jgi:hypothetical protein
MAPIEQMKAKGDTDAAVDAIENLVRTARAVPLTDQVRLNLKEGRGVRNFRSLVKKIRPPAYRA